MRANTVWGFMGIAVALLIWWAQAKGTTFGTEWGSWLLFGVALSIAGVVAASIWPYVRGASSVEREHLAELRHANELERYNADPAIRAFIDARTKDIQVGQEPQDTQLGVLVLLLMSQTHWGRWQAAQHGIPVPVQPPVTNKTFLRLSESHLLHQLDQGTLAARGFYNGDTDDIRFVSPDWWGRVYFEVVDDKFQIYRAMIKPRHNVNPAVCNKFTFVSCELPKFFALFPKEDPQTGSFEPENS